MNRDFVPDWYLSRIGATQNSRGQFSRLFADLVKISAVIEQGPAIRFTWCDTEHRNMSSLPDQTTESAATLTVTSPPIHKASAPRATSESSASSTEFEFSTLASNNSILHPWQTLRAFSTKARELASAGFQATPTLFRLGNISRAIRKASCTGRKLPMPTKLRG